MEFNAEMIFALIIPWGIKIIIALAIFLIGKKIARAIAKMVKEVMRKSNLDEMLVKFIGGILYAVLFVAVVLAAVDQLGVNVTSLLAVLGAAGLAVGLALKDSLSNFASGVMIILFKPFKIGDFITANGTSGVVDEIGLFCTLLHTGDNQRIIMPNSGVFGSTIVNASALPTRRIDLMIGISYDDNMGKAKEIILDVIGKDSRVLTDPAPVVAVAELADSSVNLVVRPWVNSADYWAARWDLTENIKNSLDEAGISIPYPQQDVHMHTAG